MCLYIKCIVHIYSYGYLLYNIMVINGGVYGKGWTWNRQKPVQLICKMFHMPSDWSLIKQFNTLYYSSRQWLAFHINLVTSLVTANIITMLAPMSPYVYECSHSVLTNRFYVDHCTLINMLPCEHVVITSSSRCLFVDHFL